MQTFLPFADLVVTAEVLDDRRLGKQRVETLQILRALTCDAYGWAAHPAVTMWRGHVPALVAYGTSIVAAWQRRGYADTTGALIAEFAHPDPPREPNQLTAALLPPWWGDPELHLSHRSALLAKDPAWYGPRFPARTPDDLPYVWPPPPAPPHVHGPRSAWVVRGHLRDDDLTVELPRADEPWVPLDARTGRVTKADRQVARFLDQMCPGDLALVPDGAHLVVVEVAGPHQRRGGHDLRPVRRVGVLARASLRVPAALQDPQVVFPLYDEPGVVAPPHHGARRG